MYRKAGVRPGVYFNPTFSSRAWTRPGFGPKSVKKPGEPKNKAISTHKCMLENWLSLGSDNGEIEVATAAKCCVEWLNMLAKNLSSKYW